MVRELPPRASRNAKREREPTPPKIKNEPATKRRAAAGRYSRGARDVPEVVPVEPEPIPEEKPPVKLLPTKVVDGQPLPTLKEPQSAKLSNAEYQSVAESAVLLASIERSRKGWSQHIFERFWSKARYKTKKEIEEEKRQGNGKATKEAKAPTMTRLGECTLTIDPHIFDIILYMVKDTTQPAVYTPPPTNQQFVQYGPTYRPAPSAPPPPPPQYSHAPYRPPISTTPISTPKPSPKPPIPASYAAHYPPSVTASKPPTPINQVKSSQPPPAPTPKPYAAPSVSTPTPRPAAPAASSTNGTAATVSASPSAAPTIQAPKPPPVAPAASPIQNEEIIKTLAARAQENQRLKEIMQVVAKGNANPEELGFFQQHIDNITQMVNSRRKKEEDDKRRAAAAAAATAAATSAFTSAAPASSSLAAHSTPAVKATSTPMGNATHLAATPTPPAPKPATLSTPSTTPAVQAPSNIYNPQSVRPPPAQSVAKPSYPPSTSTPRPPTPATPYYAAPRPSPQIYTPVRYNNSIVSTPASTSTYRKPPGIPLHVLIEFASNPNDRFLFPVHSILQYSPNMSSVLASFLIIKKGHQAADPDAFADQEAEYYQPVTVRIAVKNVKELEMLGFLARVVKPQEEVRKYMEDVFKRAKRVEDSFLAMRLPWKEGVGEDGERVEE